MSNSENLEEYVKRTAEDAIIKIVVSAIESKLPEGETIESCTDKELEKALDKLDAEVREEE